MAVQYGSIDVLIRRYSCIYHHIVQVLQAFYVQEPCYLCFTVCLNVTWHAFVHFSSTLFVVLLDRYVSFKLQIRGTETKPVVSGTLERKV